MKKEKVGFIAIAVTLVFGVIAVFLHDPIPQDTKGSRKNKFADFRRFEDGRTIFNVPNFWNVLSNLPFLLVGILGMHGIRGSGNVKIPNEMRPVYFIFFFGNILGRPGVGLLSKWATMACQGC